MQMSEEDVLAYVMLVHNAKKVCFLYYKSLKEIEEFAFDGLMNFLSNKKWPLHNKWSIWVLC